MKPAVTSGVAAAILLAAATAVADLDAIVEDCNGCHGDDGVSQWDDMPTIAGIDAFVHSDALYIYRDRERPCATTEYRQGDTSRSPTSRARRSTTKTVRGATATAAPIRKTRRVSWPGSGWVT